ncbi:translation elongation factor Ts [Candidatus Nomurabacteria bacterium RIFCSPLOWO2_01_FULL_41_12]|uniref:Elongation factor Ts n=1 Tax=Candidatus Nomurabacteria bacterium RIFCSPLOWO2_01_FULL_41_12 TaxID=1801774 RepID=A0A1F6WWM3_9BACT|nr:MAG: translation elongation factor Ts [Candidatus Nomurabacteria bacterium RIFCSPHIGHO2_01_FULL_40_10]OGI86279.1 MAG: translation elongation factor Ts [Candidatus Nomurabacteria bacterium RIFCSPLOWO2_01_FULL_41_12]
MPTKITTELIKELRDATGISVMQCKHALIEAKGDMKKALAILKKTSSNIALKKVDRLLGSGYIHAYVHGEGKIGAMVELLCETDFVAKNEVFKVLAKEIAMQIAATDPKDIQALLQEPFIKNGEINIISLVEEAIQKTGERIEIGRYARFELSKK